MIHIVELVAKFSVHNQKKIGDTNNLMNNTHLKNIGDEVLSEYIFLIGQLN